MLNLKGEVIENNNYIFGTLNALATKNQSNPHPTPLSNSAEKKKVIELIKKLGMTMLPMAPSMSYFENFETRLCTNTRKAWIKFLTTARMQKIVFKFKHRCDIQGTFGPSVQELIPIDIQIRNLEGVNSGKGLLKCKVTPKVNLNFLTECQIKEGVLNHSGTGIYAHFDMTYSAVLNPKKTDDLVAENIGGKVIITKIQSEKVNIEENFSFGEY